MHKTLEITLKSRINTKLPNCDDKAVVTDDDGAYVQETQVPYAGQEVGRRRGTEEVVVIWSDSVVLVWSV